MRHEDPAPWRPGMLRRAPRRQVPAVVGLWTGVEDSRLKAMVAEGKSYRESARALGRSRMACIGRAYRLGLCKSKATP